MKKKLVLLLTCSMLITSGSSVAAAEFSSGTPDTAALSEAQFTDEFTEPDSMYQDAADIFTADEKSEHLEEIPAGDDIILASSEDSQSLQLDTPYTIKPGDGVDFDEESEEYVFAFTPPKDGDYSFSISYAGEKPLKRYYNLYTDSDCYEDWLDRIDLSENVVLFSSLEGGYTYYFSAVIAWKGDNDSVSFTVKEATSALTLSPDVPFKFPADLDDSINLHFSPSETGYYYLMFSDGWSHDYEVYKKENEESVWSTYLNVLWKDAYLLNAGENYYFRIEPEDCPSVTLVKGKSDQEALRDLFKAAIPLTESQETTFTLAPGQYDPNQKEAFFVFTPSQTAQYVVSNNTEPSSFAYRMNIGFYDENFNFIERFTPAPPDSQNLPISLNKGCKYYIWATEHHDGSIPSDTRALQIIAKPSVTSLEIVSGPSRRTLYTGIDVTSEIKGGVHLPDFVLKATYDDGYTEIMDIRLYGYKVYATKYGDVYSCRLNGIDYVQSAPPAGTYTLTISVGGKSLTLDNIVIKGQESLPTIKKQGKGDAVINASKSAFIRLKTGSANLYNITVASDDPDYPALFTVYKNEMEIQSSEEYYSSGSSILLEPDSFYIISTGSYKQKDSKISKLTVTVTPVNSANISACKITLPSSVKYTGKALSPKVTVKYGSATLTKGKDYTVAYKNNTKLGKGTVVITGKGSFKGKVTKSFKIVPAAPSGFKASKSSSGIKLQWKKVNGASGYEISLYKNNKWTKLKTTSKITYTDKAVKKGTTYKYKVRAYSTVSGKKVYGGYTSVKSVKF